MSDGNPPRFFDPKKEGDRRIQSGIGDVRAMAHPTRSDGSEEGPIECEPIGGQLVPVVVDPPYETTVVDRPYEEGDHFLRMQHNAVGSFFADLTERLGDEDSELSRSLLAMKALFGLEQGTVGWGERSKETSDSMRADHMAKLDAENGGMAGSAPADLFGVFDNSRSGRGYNQNQEMEMPVGFDGLLGEYSAPAPGSGPIKAKIKAKAKRKQRMAAASRRINRRRGR